MKLLSPSLPAALALIIAMFPCIAPASGPDRAQLSLSAMEKINQSLRISDDYIIKGQDDSALIVIGELINIDSTLAIGYYHKALCHARRGEDSMAIECLQQAISKNMCLTSYADILYEEKILGRVRQSEFWSKIDSLVASKIVYLLAQEQADKNFSLELARIFTVQDDIPAAVQHLERACKNGFSDPAVISYDRDFREHSDFLLTFMQRTMQKLYAWDGSLDQKIWGLMLVYAGIKYNCANLHLADFKDWDMKILEYIPLVAKARSKLEYYQVLQKLVAQINDDHTYIEYPTDMLEGLDRPPLSLVGLQNKYFVKRIFDENLQRAGLASGMELIKIDHVPVTDYAAQNVYPYIPDKPDHSANWDCARKLLVGKKGSAVLLTLKNREGKERDFKVKRNAKQVVRLEYRPLVEIKYLARGYVYFNIRMFDNDAARLFAELFNTLDLYGLKGMIIDLRDNPGGYSEAVDEITSHLTAVPMVNYEDCYSPVYIPPIEPEYARISWKLDGQGKVILPAPTKHYGGPLLILTSPLTCSAAEDFIVPFKKNGRALVVGLPTSGGTGNSVLIHLPGGGYLRVCVLTCPAFVGAGIIPDYLIYPNATDIVDNTDPTITKAIEILDQKIFAQK